MNISNYKQDVGWTLGGMMQIRQSCEKLRRDRWMHTRIRWQPPRLLLQTEANRLKDPTLWRFGFNSVNQHARTLWNRTQTIQRIEDIHNRCLLWVLWVVCLTWIASPHLLQSQPTPQYNYGKVAEQGVVSNRATYDAIGIQIVLFSGPIEPSNKTYRCFKER